VCADPWDRRIFRLTNGPLLLTFRPMSPPTQLRAEWKSAMADIDRVQWNSLALPHDSPFQEWEWLHLLEESGSVGPTTGWRPLHLTVWRGKTLVGAAPLYIKADSEGEFVFDQLWAGTALKLGIPYYPKLLGMSPFTPTGTYRFLHAPGVDLPELSGLMSSEMERVCRGAGLCSMGFNFIDQGWGDILSGLGYSLWTHQGFCWINEGLSSFEEYLSLLNANARRNIRRERAFLRKQSISTRMVSGDGLTPELLELMHRLYCEHNERFGPWSCRFLTPAFFLSIPDQLRHRIVLCVATSEKDPETVLGMSMLVRKGDRLYGRYWGAPAHIDFLHFELCYYAPIEWAIEHSIRRFDPGMGGRHKTRRGFTAVPTFSAHKLMNPLMRRIMETHLVGVNLLEKREIDALNKELPFARRDNGPLVA
jgi:uncharacterized protein